MYYQYFGLKEPPYKITPNTDFFFSGGNRGAILDALVYAITQGEGIVKVVGEVGSGKTMLCRMLQTILPENIESVYLANPSVSPEDVLYAIAFELQLDLPENADRLKVMQALQAYLLQRHEEGRQVVIFVEEAQGMPLATLEEVRLLSNLETRQDKLLQIVLFGQPELDENLNQEHIRQLRERITHRFSLGPLHTKDVGEYLIFRLRAAGYHGPHLFTEAAVRKLSKASEGLVRRINILADKALLSAFADNVYQVTPRHVNAAINDSEFRPKPRWYQFHPEKFAAYQKYLFMLVVLILVALSAWYLGTTQMFNSKNKAAQPQPANTKMTTPSAVQASEKSVPVVMSQQQLVINQRFDATRRLLTSASPDTVTLQIQTVPAQLSSDGQITQPLLSQALENLGKQLEIDNIYLYRTHQNGSDYTVILYGAFAQRADALSALESMSEAVKAHQPYLRTLAGVKRDMALAENPVKQP